MREPTPKNFIENLYNVVMEQIYFILDEVAVSVYWKDLKGRYLGCNKHMLVAVGKDDRQDVIGKTDKDLIWKDIAPNLEKIDRLVIKEKQKYEVEETPLIATGKRVIYLTTKTPLYDAQKNIIGVVGVSVDITDRKKVEEYRLKNEAAQKVINFSNLVAGSIAHELKNPLGGIRQQMETWQGMALNVDKISPKDRDDFVKNVASQIIRTIDETTYIIDDMLKKVRSFATGTVHHGEFEETYIASDIENLLNTYPFKNDERELVNVLCNSKFKYLGDKTLTAHVLSNLMRNALHAIKETSKDNASVTIETKTKGNFNLLIFKDTAIGISSDFIDKIFDQFETKKDIHGGTGLGLAFCKSVMEDTYGGNIICNSKEGKYAEFVLSFPKIQKP